MTLGLEQIELNLNIEWTSLDLNLELADLNWDKEKFCLKLDLELAEMKMGWVSLDRIFKRVETNVNSFVLLKIGQCVRVLNTLVLARPPSSKKMKKATQIYVTSVSFD